MLFNFVQAIPNVYETDAVAMPVMMAETPVPVGPKYSCGTGVELQQASEPLVAVDLSALLPNQRRQ